MIWTPSKSKKLVTVEDLNAELRSGSLATPALAANHTFRQHRNERRLGPIGSAVVSAVATQVADGVTFTQAYAIAQANGPFVPPAGWPADNGQGLNFMCNANYVYPGSPASYTPRSLRVMTDSDKVCFLIWNTIGSAGWQIFVDGAPAQLDPVPLGSATWYIVVTLESAGTPREVELRTSAATATVYCRKPYTCWLPQPLRSPRVYVVGDSYLTTFWTPGGAGTTAMLGIYPTIGDDMDVQDLWMDGVGGTGYIKRTAGNNNYLDRLAQHVAAKPDMLVVHGGGANDFATGNTVAEVQAQARDYFTQARQALPDAKLVFVEGFGPPTGYAAFNSNYALLSANLKPVLASVGVHYVDVATSSPWIAGTGYQSATTAVGNSDVYVGNDGVHLTVAGAKYVRKRMAPILQSILNGKKAVNT